MCETIKGYKTVIGTILIYYLQLEFWWWIILVIAVIIDSNNEYANNTNSANIVNKLNNVENELADIKELLDNIESK